MLVINKDLPFKSLPELVAYAKAHPGKLAYGSAGVGASNHLSGEATRRAGIDLNHIPYKGNAPAMTDVIGGQLAMMFDIIGTGRNYVNTGRVRAVAVTSKDRNAAMPDVPSTCANWVLPTTTWAAGTSLYGPPKMPADMVQRFHTAVQRTLALDEFKAKLAEQGYDQWNGSPQTLSERAARERALWATVAKGIQVE